MKMIHIIQKSGKIGVLLAVIICAVSTMPGVSGLSYKASIQVRQTAEIEADKNREFTYELRSRGMPMPEGSEGERYIFTISGTSVKEIPIVYGHAGEYEYSIRQIVNNPQERYMYDSREYAVTVRVLNSSQGLKSEIYTSEMGSGKTDGGVEFVNTYTPMKKEPEKEESKKSGTLEALSVLTKRIRTGDSADCVQWITAGTVSLALFAVMAYRRKEERDEKE